MLRAAPDGTPSPAAWSARCGKQQQLRAHRAPDWFPTGPPPPLPPPPARCWQAALASGLVDIVLVPEVAFNLDSMME